MAEGPHHIGRQGESQVGISLQSKKYLFVYAQLRTKDCSHIQVLYMIALVCLKFGRKNVRK